MRAMGIAAVLAALSACQSSTAPTVAATVTIAEYSFTSDTVTIAAGTAVRWANGGTVAHTVTSDSGAFASGQLAQPGMDAYGGMTAGAPHERSLPQAGEISFPPQQKPPPLEGVRVAPH